MSFKTFRSLVSAALLGTCVAAALLETVVYQNYTLQQKQIDSGTAWVSKSCACRSLCTAISCTTYSVTEVAEHNFLCQFSTGAVPFTALQPKLSGPRSFVVHKSALKLVGLHFYLLSSPASPTTRTNSSLACKDIGGILPVANTPELMTELEQAMQAAGVQKTWLGLFMPVNDIRPKWFYENGSTVVDATVTVTPDHSCYMIDMALTGANRINNLQSCGAPTPFICQRSF